MDKDVLEAWLAEGLSLEEMGQRAGRHPSTVSYWLRRHGLRAGGAARHTPRGAIGRDELERLVDEGRSIRDIARTLERSPTTVRHWLARYDIPPARARRGPAGDGDDVERLCPHHGLAPHRRRSDGGYRCVACRSDAVARRRREVKEILVAEAGGRCVRCGYDRCLRPLGFHHLDPATKSFGIGFAGFTRSLAKARLEARKCVLLCANCHMEIEAGLNVVLPPADTMGRSDPGSPG
jgi:transposase